MSSLTLYFFVLNSHVKVRSSKVLWVVTRLIAPGQFLSNLTNILYILLMRNRLLIRYVTIRIKTNILNGLNVDLLTLSSPFLKAADITNIKAIRIKTKKDIPFPPNLLNLLSHIKDFNMKEIRCFIENAALATPNNRTISPIYELSEEGKTFAKRKERRTIKGDDRNLLHSFHVTEENELNAEETRLIIKVVESFNTYLETVTVENKPVIVTKFTSFFNKSFDENIRDFHYNELLHINKKYYPDYITFVVGDLSCAVWLSDASFKLFYPLYDIDVVTPFDEFDDIIRNAPMMIEALNKFDLNKFGVRIDNVKGGFPSTYTQMLNVPYRPRKDAREIDCWFGFNIYGEAGNYEYLMRDELYKYLKKLGLDDEFIEEHFPSIFRVNEFFFVPEWEEYALPFRVGQGSINSHVNKAYVAPFRINWYVRAYQDSDSYLKENTYNVPLPYNNILCRVVNGKYSLDEVKDFRQYFKDLITVNSTNPDFPRMTEKTQRFVIMISYMIAAADAKSQTELFNNLMSNNSINKDHKFTITRRMEVTYISIQFGPHRYYMIPRFEFNRITESNTNG